MWNERFVKVIPAVVFLFCLLEIFELVLIINDMNKTEKLETEIRNNLKLLEDITILFNKHLEGMENLEHKKKRQCNSI
ncbi:hypothetical protein HPHPA11_1043 [Helicobacter pylori Hp A-11]|uniref:Uncharacterized protein n=1 Tax=Helicobacter pylori Hp A-11 TaxID=992035 RepID=N4TL12_HELPX|nr:hypothetical protein [Helicobacter pylori]ENH59897.1 hypothetical protein HPHPA11_1043 [Helicobacter pylori Hp A-11]